MNRDEGSYQLSHIYDRQFVATFCGERKLSRQFRGRLTAITETSTEKYKRLYLDKVLLDISLL